ncbi:MAG: hypothetical protein CMJ78_16410 [Planctomycetaceae bacterium]|nr:hypothetical protein [Planctomycetaceae bacterium]
MKIRAYVAAFASVMILTTAFAAEGKIDLKGIKCAMNGKAAAKADKSVSFNGGKVFFCCGNCAKGFETKNKKDEKLRAKGNGQLVATKQAKQAKCPFSGGKLNPSTAIKVASANNASVAFCCNNCKGKAEKLSGDDQLVKLLGDAAWKKGGFKVAKAKK